MKLDLYSIVRSFKLMSNTESKHPLINIFYFGDFHIKNINGFLKSKTHNFKIDIPNQPIDPDPNKANRCMDLTSSIVNLNDLVNKLKTRRSRRSS